MAFFFGNQSLKQLDTCRDDLQKVAKYALQHSPYDFSIIEGHRSLERQNMLYRNGLSKIDGVIVKSRHNYEPAEAFDFMPYPGILNNISVWNEKPRWYMIAGIILSAGEACKISLRWGGDWDGDGSTKDQTFHDLGHFELRRTHA
jgi:peptidoglycan L-alanyl-D-glutamate endopeptidase CwlK